jgi:restriction system protein
VYPDWFEVDVEPTFDSATQELALLVTIFGPDQLPSVREHKYNRAKDEITSSALPQKDLKDRYASAVHQVAIRAFHEVFEADREGRIKTVALLVETEALDPGTGTMTRTSFVAAAADRETFLTFDLSKIVPLATLGRLNAVVSKNPFGLVGIDGTKGVRG